MTPKCADRYNLIREFEKLRILMTQFGLANSCPMVKGPVVFTKHSKHRQYVTPRRELTYFVFNAHNSYTNTLITAWLGGAQALGEAGAFRFLI